MWTRESEAEVHLIMMRVLVIEDESKTAAYLEQGLSEAGFVVDVARRGDEGYLRARTGAPDLVVLDITLPRRDGWQILRDLRGQGVDIPILCLTARDAVSDRVRGLDLGADDYLVKPFAFSELLARIRSLLRRGGPQVTDVLAVSDLEVDLIRRRARRAGRGLDLSPKEFSLLAFLVRRQGEVLSRAMLAAEVWGMPRGTDSNVVDVAIRRLRAKVDEPFDTHLIHTVRGVGYVLEARPERS